eukprot:g2381.t1
MLGPGSRANGAGRGTASCNAYHGAYIGGDSLAPAYTLTQPRRKVSRAGNVGEMQYPGNNHGSGGSYHHHAGDNHNQRQPPHHRGGFPSTRGGAKYPSSCSDDDAQAFASGDEGGRRLMGSPGARRQRHQSLAGTGAGEHLQAPSGDARRRAALDSNKPFVPKVAPAKPKPWIPRRDRRAGCHLHPSSWRTGLEVGVPLQVYGILLAAWRTTAPASGPPSDEWGIWLEVEARTTGAGAAKRGWIEMIRSEVFGQEIRGEMEDWALAAEIARVRRETNAVLVRFHVFPDPGIDFERSSYTHAALLDGLEREAVQFRVHSAAAVSAPVSPVHWFSHSLDFDLFLGAFRRVSPKLFLERAQKLASLEARGQQAPAAGGKPGFMSPQTSNESGTATSSTAVAASLSKAKDLSYYHAHNRAPEDLSNATKLEGKGLCRPDGLPEPVDENDERYFDRTLNQRSGQKIVMIEKYLFEDAGKYAKVHVNFENPEILKFGETKITYDEWGLGMQLDVVVPTANAPAPYNADTIHDAITFRFLVKDRPFHGAIDPTKATHKVSSDKTRIVFKLLKLVDDHWPQFLEKKMNQHTGWS